MTINLPKDLEQFVLKAVEAGHYARWDDVISDALSRLRQAMPDDPALPDLQPWRAAAGKRKRPSPKNSSIGNW
jgi:Arc/MetJ-type ribon-helix-helix transcriptional regulator